MPTASVIIIGDEILSGKFPDENGPFFIRRLRALGVALQRLAVVRDTLDDIAQEVNRCAAASDYVFTTGGVGPTHDDVTFEAVAQAFGLPLVVHPELEALIDRFGLPKDAATMRMATVPEGTSLFMPQMSSFHILQLRNLYILPGVPRLMQEKFELIAPQIAGEAVRCVRVYAKNRETVVAGKISAVAEAFPQLSIGSYPRFGREDHQLIVTLEGRDDALLARATDAVAAFLDVVRVVGP